MNISARLLAPLALVALVGCSDDDDPIDTPLDGGVDSSVRDASLDGRIDGAADASVCNRDLYLSPQGCVQRLTCVPGSYVSAPGSDTTDRICTACPEGTYTSTNNATSCTRLDGGV